MKTHVIQLNEFDDLISINDKIGWSKAARVLVIWPNAGKIQLSILDLLLILRKADSLGSQMAVVSDEPRILEQCKYLGIQVFDSIPEAYKKPWRRSMRIKHRSLQDDRFKNKPENFKQPVGSLNKTIKIPLPVRWGIFIISILSLLLLIGFFVPSADIQVKAVPQKKSVELNAWASPTNKKVSLAGGIPVQIFRVIEEDSVEGISSGYIRVSGNYAQGELTFRNLTTETVNVPAGTIVQTSGNDPVRFRTLNSLQLAAGIGSVGVVEARSTIAGVIGNVAANSINSIEGAVGGSVAVINDNQFSGGTDIKSLSPSSIDMEKVQSEVKRSLTEKALLEFEDLYAPENLLVKDTFSLDKILYEEISPPIGSAGERFRYQLRCEFSMWMISMDDLNQLALQTLQASMPSTYQVDENSIQIKLTTEPVLESNDILQLSILASAQIDPVLNSEQLANSIISLEVPKAISKIEENGEWQVITNPVINPSFWKKLPFLSMRIKVAQDG